MGPCDAADVRDSSGTSLPVGGGMNAVSGSVNSGNPPVHRARSVGGLTTWEYSEDSPVDTSRRTFILLAWFCLLGGLVYGYNLSLGGVLDALAEDYGIKDDDVKQALIQSAPVAGGLVFSPFCGWFADRYGRLRATVISCCIASVAAGVQVIGSSLPYILVVRFFLGVGVTTSCFVVPLYVCECAPPEKRGSLVALFQLSINIGFSLAFGVDLLVPWRVAVAVGCVPGIALIAINLLYVPESTRLLLERDVRGRLSKVHGLPSGGVSTDAVPLFDPAATSPEYAHPSPSKNEAENQYAPHAVGLVGYMLGFVLAILNNGIGGIILYGPQIAEEAGFGTHAGTIASVGIGGFCIVTVIIGIVIVDRVRRRPLLLLTVLIMVVTHGVLAAGLAWAHSWLKTVIVLVSTVVLVSAFQIGPGPLYFVIIAEIYPQSVRGWAMGVSMITVNAFNLVVSLTFLPSIHKLGTPVTLLYYAGLYTLCILFCALYLPETKDVDLDAVTGDARTVPQQQRILPTDAMAHGEIGRVSVLDAEVTEKTALLGGSRQTLE
eukprot:Opistho-2@46579